MEDEMISNGDLLDVINKGFQGVQNQLNGIEGRLGSVENRLSIVEGTMVTKDFLERRLAKTDGKIAALTNVLEAKGVITEDEKRLIYT